MIRPEDLDVKKRVRRIFKVPGAQRGGSKRSATPLVFHPKNKEVGFAIVKEYFNREFSPEHKTKATYMAKMVEAIGREITKQLTSTQYGVFLDGLGYVYNQYIEKSYGETGTLYQNYIPILIPIMDYNKENTLCEFAFESIPADNTYHYKLTREKLTEEAFIYFNSANKVEKLLMPN